MGLLTHYSPYIILNKQLRLFKYGKYKEKQKGKGRKNGNH
jgi:hypothetical protein